MKKSNQLSQPSLTAVIAMAAAMILGAPLASQAVTLQFFGEDNAGGSLPVPNSAAAEASFLSNLVGVGTEDFESAPLGSANGFMSTFAGAGSATFTGTGMDITSGPSFGTFPISGSQHLQGFANNFSIAFSAPVAAFGFYGTDVGDQGGTLTLNYTNGPATVIALSQMITNDGNAFYFGLIDTDNPFTGVSFANNQGDDRFGYDDMTIGSLEQIDPEIIVNGVPESGSTLAMLGMVFGGLALRRRKA